MAERDTHHKAPSSSGAGRRDAIAAQRAKRTTTATPTPKAPASGRRMTSRRRWRVRWGSRPSDASTRPSRWSRPVTPRSAATTRAAATAAGHQRPATHQAPPRIRPSPAPTAGNQGKARGPGRRAPPTAVRKDTASYIRASQRQDPTGHHQEDLVGHGGHRPVEIPQSVAEATTGLGGGMHPEADLLGHHERRLGPVRQGG